MKQALMALVMAGTLFTASYKAEAGNTVTGFASEVTQILNNVQLVLQVLEQIKTYERLVMQFENMLLNTEKWEELFFGRGMDMLLELADAVNKDELLSYVSGSLADQYAEKYPGYEEYLALGIDGWTPEKIVEEHTRWNAAQRSNVLAALEATHLHNAEFATEEDLITALEIQSSTAIGRQQALQAGNAIAVEGLRQSQKLRQLIMTQIQLQANYQAYEAEKEAAKRALSDLHSGSLREAQTTEIIRGDGTVF